MLSNIFLLSPLSDLKQRWQTEKNATLLSIKTTMLIGDKMKKSIYWGQQTCLCLQKLFGKAIELVCGASPYEQETLKLIMIKTIYSYLKQPIFFSCPPCTIPIVTSYQSV